MKDKSFKLSPEDAERVKNANIANILKKAKAGKPLSRDELKIIEAQNDGGVIYESIAQCSEATGISRADLKRAKLKGGADAGFRGSRVEWVKLREWLEKNKGDESETLDKHALECRRLLAQCLKIEDGNARERGEYVNRAEWESALAGRIARAVATLRQKFVVELPVKQVGLHPAAIAEQNEKALAEVIEIIRV